MSDKQLLKLLKSLKKNVPKKRSPKKSPKNRSVKRRSPKGRRSPRVPKYTTLLDMKRIQKKLSGPQYTSPKAPRKESCASSIYAT